MKALKGQIRDFTNRVFRGLEDFGPSSDFTNRVFRGLEDFGLDSRISIVLIFRGSGLASSTSVAPATHAIAAKTMNTNRIND